MDKEKRKCAVKIGDSVRAILRVVLFVVFLIYFVLFLRMMFFRPGYLRPETDVSWLEYASARTNFVPFRSVTEYISAIKNGTITPFEIAKNLLGNFFLFFPFGLILTLLFRFFRSPRRFAAVLALSVAVAELLQLVTMVGICDIDDMILNYVGAFAGFALARLILHSEKSVFLTETERKTLKRVYKSNKNLNIA